MAERQPGDLAGLVLSSAALKVDEKTAPLLQKASGLLSRFAPHLKTVKLSLDGLSRDPTVARNYAADPLTYTDGVRARTGAEVLEASRRIGGMAGRVTVPLYLFHGTADAITDPEGTKRFHADAASTDKTLRLYEGFYHETFNEPEKQRVLDDLAAWITERLPAR